MADTLKKDIAVIGGGPGGYVAAIRAAQLGASVALVEQDALGGTCINRGCIPTKLLLHAAEIIQESRQSAEYGIETGELRVDFARLMKRKDTVVSLMSRGVESLMRSNDIQVIRAPPASPRRRRWKSALTIKVKQSSTAKLSSPPARYLLTCPYPAPRAGTL